jgi:ABC-type transport system substrate-binding protein
MKGTVEQTNYGNYVGNIKTVTAPDDTTLVMTTKEPSPLRGHHAACFLIDESVKKEGGSRVGR